jgi:hypothetical protein
MALAAQPHRFERCQEQVASRELVAKKPSLPVTHFIPFEMFCQLCGLNSMSHYSFGKVFLER